MMADIWPSLISATAVAFIGLLFARAAWHKLSDFTAFTGFVADYEMVKPEHVGAMSVALVALECAVPVSFLVPGLHLVGVILAIGLLTAYATGIAINLNRGRDRIECGCGGAVQPLSWNLVRRNGILAALSALALIGSPAALSVAEALSALAGGLTLFVGYLLAEQIMATTATMRLRR